MSQPPGVIISATHRFAASPDAVFSAFLDPTRAGEWLFATAGGQMLQATLDPRVGGTFLVRERRAAGEAAHFGTFVELTRPSRITFRFAVEPNAVDPDVISVDMLPLPGGGCEATLRHTLKPQWVAYAEKTAQGWAGVLKGLGRVVDGDAQAAPAR